MIALLRYRPDIDGLRAIAILLVVAGHIGVPGFAGGFIGVDIFFVISGYLITGLLWREQSESGRISIAGFYARRARRLLPALCTMIAATLLLSLLFLLPDEQAGLARSALASLGFAANFWFWQIQQNYFSDSAQLLPLQHLWTLAVEEQFYLLWPIALGGAAWLATRLRLPPVFTIMAILAAGTIASLALSIVLSGRMPVPSYLLLHTRAWELGAGALLAFAPAVPTRLAPWLALAGAALIAAGLVIIQPGTPFPSFYALFPVVGAAALIAGESRILAARPLVVLGKLSYGWYLWHWPLLAFARNEWGTDPALLRDGVLALVALALAAASLRWIETPIRERRFAPFRTNRATLTASVLLLATSALLALSLWAWSSRPPAPGTMLAQYQAARGGASRDFPFCKAGPRCETGDRGAGPAILLWGDSHAAHLGRGLDRAARTGHVRLIARTIGGCLPGGIERDDCVAFDQAVLASLPELRRAGVTGVILAGAWVPIRPGDEARIDALAARIRAAGFRLLLVQDVPLQPQGFARCLIRKEPGPCAPSRASINAFAKPSDDALARIAARHAARVWSPRDALCLADTCPAAIGGQLLYRNRNHLTLAGSERLAPSLAPEIAWLAPIR